MKKPFLLLALLITVFALHSNAQLYMPRDISKAFAKGTRSMDGKPGKNYWQNFGRYNITVTATPPDRNIKGTETIMYTNNSPDTLRNPVIRFFLNIHKPGVSREGGAGKDYLTDGVFIDEFTVNGQKAPIRTDANVGTALAVRLPKPLFPHDSTLLSFTWHYQISLQSNREGMIDSTTYFLAYFYPRVAVYDDYNGWDRMLFVDSHEFYSDFNDYTVTVNVPKNYIVWGTGTLQRPETLLQPTYLNRFKESLTSDKTIRIVTKEDLATKNITTQNAMNSWEFRATDIPDMTFGLSDHFVWDGSSVIVDDNTHRRASAQAVYNDTAQDFHYMTDFVKHSLSWFSHNWPGVPYPYEKSTVFQGFADMEYPMMVNDGTNEDTVFSKFVAEHEIAHTYMPFYMGINETRYGFMDEGWATTFELLIGRDDMGIEKAEAFYKQFRVAGWINDPSSGEDIPIVTPGDNLTGIGLGNNEYGKPSLGYLAVKDLLGDAQFKKCLQEYMSRWHGKHPIPWDFFNTFNNTSGKDLNWFWSNWFFSNGYIDFAVKDVKQTSTGIAITLQNKGGFAAPTDLLLTYTDGSTETKNLTPETWKLNMQQAVITISTKKKIRSVKADGGIFMDADMTNNSWGK
jgi:hypothetical protein